jgi:hypothetical protein
MRTIFETAVESERFSKNDVRKAVVEAIRHTDYSHIHPALDQIESAFPRRQDYESILQNIARFAFFIEPVKKPKIETTKFAVRWSSDLERDDPRKADYEACLQIFEHLISGMAHVASEPGVKDVIRRFLEFNAIAYEMPIDYRKRRAAGAMHEARNVVWFWEGPALAAPALREELLRHSDHDTRAFFKNTYGKVIVKSHLTDRVLTGKHKTNREKRWEAHPASVHFATRRDCLSIEASLINQLCYFKGFPPTLQAHLEAKKLISFQALPDPILSAFTDRVMRCPITLEPLSYVAFKHETLNPSHGKALYQVGHLHPLKAAEAATHNGHTAENIGWISAQGNRIQGELSVEETRQLLERIFVNYERAGIL